MKNKDKYVSKWVGKILHIYDWTYRQNYYFIPAKNHEEYRKITKQQLNCEIKPKDQETGGGFNVFEHGKDKTEVCYIWAEKKRNIVHECFHAISYVLRHRNIPCMKAVYGLSLLLINIMKLSPSSSPP